MRVRCSKGLSISQFHGHFFVRSIDLLSLPQVGPLCFCGKQEPQGLLCEQRRPESRFCKNWGLKKLRSSAPTGCNERELQNDTQ